MGHRQVRVLPGVGARLTGPTEVAGQAVPVRRWRDLYTFLSYSTTS